LVPGEAARIERHDGATVTPVCSGQMITAGDLSQALQLAVTADHITASVGGTARVSCDHTKDPIAPEPGSWGVAATANGTLTVVTIDASR
jgi:hypothetical protein